MIVAVDAVCLAIDGYEDSVVVIAGIVGGLAIIVLV